MIGGTEDNLEEGDINPLTGDKLDEYLKSKSTAREIEVWKITFLDWRKNSIDKSERPLNNLRNIPTNV